MIIKRPRVRRILDRALERQFRFLPLDKLFDAWLEPCARLIIKELVRFGNICPRLRHVTWLLFL